MAQQGNTQDQSTPTPAAPAGERVPLQKRDPGTWQVIQQGAQVVGELGGGIGGIAAAVHVADEPQRVWQFRRSG